MCGRVCVRERERKRVREKERKKWMEEIVREREVKIEVGHG